MLVTLELSYVEPEPPASNTLGSELPECEQAGAQSSTPEIAPLKSVQISRGNGHTAVAQSEHAPKVFQDYGKRAIPFLFLINKYCSPIESIYPLFVPQLPLLAP